MKYYAPILIFLIHLSLPDIVLGQKEGGDLISGEFKGLSVEQFIKELENEVDFHFYYDASQPDSLQVTLFVQKQPLTKVLEQAFAGTGFYYSIDPWKRVYISKKKPVITSFPQGLFNRTGFQNHQAREITEPEDGINVNKVENTTLENKLYEIGDKTNINGQSKFTIAGNVVDGKTGEPISGASVYVEKLGIGAVTDQFGYYSISIPRGRYTLNIQSLGMRDTKRQLILYGDGKMN